MKKNININLCGRLFQIDEDACDMLQHYIDSLRSAFGRQEGGDEIVDDIEARIAELFDELKNNGNDAITIEHVKSVITRIGRPEELTGEDTGAQKDWQQKAEETFNDVRSKLNQASNKMAGRRLYRNPNDKMVAGVLSGLAAYTDIDVTFWRLGAVLLTFCYGTGILLYIVLAIILPEAKTPEDQLRMEGREVNPQNLADAVIDDRQPQRQPSNALREILSFLLKIAFGFFVVIAIFVGIIIGITFLTALIALVSALFFLPIGSTLPFSLEAMGLAAAYEQAPATLILFTVALFVLLLVPLYAIIHMVLSLSKKVQPMSTGQRIAWVVIWIIALCCIVPAGITVSYYHDEQRKEEYNQKHIYQRDFTDTWEHNCFNMEKFEVRDVLSNIAV